MAKVTVAGMCLEVFEADAVGRDEAVKLTLAGKEIPKRKVARIYQYGEKQLIEVKGVNGQCQPGEPVELICKVIAWATDRGVPGLSFSCIEESA